MLGDEYTDGYRADALHILPFSLIASEFPALRKALLANNARLEGVADLFSGTETGSAQITRDVPHRAFQSEDRGKKGLETVAALSELPGFDVYGLRIDCGVRASTWMTVGSGLIDSAGRGYARICRAVDIGIRFGPGLRSRGRGTAA